MRWPLTPTQFFACSPGTTLARAESNGNVTPRSIRYASGFAPRHFVHSQNQSGKSISRLRQTLALQYSLLGFNENVPSIPIGTLPHEMLGQADVEPNPVEPAPTFPAKPPAFHYAGFAASEFAVELTAPYEKLFANPSVSPNFVIPISTQS